MRLIFTLFFVGLLSQTTNAQEFKFETDVIDYGKIAQGSNGTRVFEFTNIGDEPIIITKVKSSCGCTVPKKPEKPIMPGKKGKIEVSYDTKRTGGFYKSITIYSNAKLERKTLKIRGFINKKRLPEKEKSMLSDS